MVLMLVHRIYLMGHSHTGRCCEKSTAGRCLAAQKVSGHSALHHAKLQDRGNTCMLMFVQCYAVVKPKIIIVIGTIDYMLLCPMQVFFRGVTVNGIRGFPMSATMFLGYELSLQFFRSF